MVCVPDGRYMKQQIARPYSDKKDRPPPFEIEEAGDGKGSYCDYLGPLKTPLEAYNQEHSQGNQCSDNPTPKRIAFEGVADLISNAMKHAVSAFPQRRCMLAGGPLVAATSHHKSQAVPRPSRYFVCDGRAGSAMIASHHQL